MRPQMYRVPFPLLYFLRAVFAAPTFYDLPQGTMITSLSADGTHGSGAMGDAVFRWDEAAGAQVQVVGHNATTVAGIPVLSADGSVLAASMLVGPEHFDTVGGAWHGADVTVLVGGPLPGAIYGIAPDSSVCVGLAGDDVRAKCRAAVWNCDGSGGVTHNSTVDGMACRANVAATRGALVGGWQDQPDGFRAGAVWDANGRQTMVVDGTGALVGEVLSMNAEGSVLTGGEEGWVKLPGAATVKILRGTTDAFGASADGALVGGGIGEGFGRLGFLWTATRGLEGLVSGLRARGVPLPANVTDEWLGAVTAVSADGTVVGGWGMHPPPKAGPTAWVARLGEPHGAPEPPRERATPSQRRRPATKGRCVHEDRRLLRMC